VPERSPWGRRLNAGMNAKVLGRELRRLGMKDPLVWAYTPEAMAVIERAIEVDVRLTLDAVPVLMHDETIGRTTD